MLQLAGCNLLQVQPLACKEPPTSCYRMLVDTACLLLPLAFSYILYAVTACLLLPIALATTFCYYRLFAATIFCCFYLLAATPC